MRIIGEKKWHRLVDDKLIAQGEAMKFQNRLTIMTGRRDDALAEIEKVKADREVWKGKYERADNLLRVVDAERRKIREERDHYKSLYESLQAQWGSVDAVNS